MNNKKNAIESLGIEHVPDSKRHGNPFNLFNIWVSTNLTVGAFVTGSLAITLGLGLFASFMAIIVGTLVGAILIPVMSKMGWRLGIPQMMMTRPVFGRIGAIPPIFFSWLNFLGWFTVLDVLGAKALNIGFGLPMLPSILVISIASIILGVLGNDMIHLAEKWIARLAGVVFIVLAILTLPKVEWGYSGSLDFASADWWGMFILTVAIAFSYAGPGYTPYASDYTRYLPKNIPFKRIFFPTFLGMSLSSMFVFMLGAAILSTNPNGDVLEVAVGIVGPFAEIAMLAFALGSIAGNAMNVYSGGLTALASGIKINRWLSVILIGALGTVIAMWAKDQFVSKYEAYLLLILYIVPAMDAIFIVDYFFVKKGRYSRDDFYGKNSPMFNVKGWIAYGLGIVVSLPMISSELYVGPVAEMLHGADVSYVISMLVAGVAYWCMHALPSSNKNNSLLQVEDNLGGL